MQVLKGIKKMAVIATGALFLGATFAGAVSVTDAKYPDNFKDNTAIVVGADALASDTIGALDIYNHLKSVSKVCTTQAEKKEVSGDSLQISDASDMLEIREELGDVRETITNNELDGLISGSISTDEGRTEYNQYIRFKDVSNPLVSPLVDFTANDDNNEVVSDYLFIAEGSNVVDAFFEYEIEFEDGLESDIDSDNNLNDLEDKELEILGKTYSIVRTQVDTTLNSIDMLLLSGNIFDSLEESEVKTYTINNKDYKVETVVIADNDDSVIFNINGELTDELQEGDTDTLEDGTIVGISAVLPNEAGEGTSGDIVEFYLGADKLELSDTDYTDGLFVTNVKVNNENLEEAYVSIRATEIGSDEFEISDIKYRLVADSKSGNDVFVKSGNRVSDYLDESEGLLGNFDIRYEGLTDTGVSVVKLNPQSDDKYELNFENKQGNEISIPFISNEAGVFKYGDEDDDLVFGEGATSSTFNIGDDDWFVLSNQNSALDENAVTSIVRYNSIDTANNQLSFDVAGAGSKTVVFTNGTASLVVGGTTYNVYVESATPYRLAVDQNSDGDVAGDEISITLNGGGILDLGTSTESGDGLTISTSSVNVTLTTKASEFDEASVDEVNDISVEQRTGNEIGLGTISNINLDESDDNDDLGIGLNDYGALFQLDDSSTNDDAETLTIEYPLSQRGPLVYVTIGDTTTTVVSGKVCSESTANVEVMLDSEIGDYTTKNVIVVGDACINRVAALIQGLPYGTCGDQLPYKAGEYVSTLIANGENVAMLVAGYNAEDTQTAIDELIG